MKNKALIAAILILLIASAVTGCGDQVSHYKALMLTRTNTSSSASMSFSSLEGTMVFKLQCGDPSDKVSYSAKLEEGRARVYIDCGGDKTELFTIGQGDEINASGGELKTGTVYIIVETDGKCRKGKFRFEIE